jgi:hypothetical protein
VKEEKPKAAKSREEQSRANGKRSDQEKSNHVLSVIN